MGGTNAVVDTRVCPYCHQPTRAGWPLCDGCARTLPAERPLPDLRLVNELERWDRANPRPRDPAALTRRTLKWLWIAVVVLSALDLRFGRHIGTGTSVWDTLAVGSIVLAFLGTLRPGRHLAAGTGAGPPPAGIGHSRRPLTWISGV
jgi:hypothetical protein